MSFRFAMCAAVLMLVPAVNAADPAAKEKEHKCDPQKFTGTYEIVSGEMDGKHLGKDELHHVKAVIKKDSIVTYDRDEKEVYVATYELEPDKVGCHITLKSTKPPEEGLGAFGLIKREGDTVTLIYALPKGEQPKEFKTHAHQHMFVMKKMSSSTSSEQKDLEKVEK